MALTREFRETVKARATVDADFRAALLSEAVELLLAGDLEGGKLVLRDYINATIGFDDLAAQLGKSPKSLMRMVGPAGNPTAENLFGAISRLQEATGVQLSVHSAAA